MKREDKGKEIEVERERKEMDERRNEGNRWRYLQNNFRLIEKRRRRRRRGKRRR